MSRLRKPLLVAGLALLLVCGAMLAYATHGEEERRNQAKASASMDYGFIPVDLLEGRTRFEGRDTKNGLAIVNTGPEGEGRVLMARVALGVGAFGLILLAFRAFLTDKR